MTTQKPERKDWILLIFIIPIAALLLLFVGQWAIRLLPFWSVNAGMNSNLEPDSGAAAHPFALLEPLLPQILIPLPWADTYLDPGEDFSFPPFLTFEPTASPSPTADTPAPTEATPTATVAPTETPTATSVVTSSPTDSDDDEEETPTGTVASPSPSPTTPSPSPTTPSPSPTTPSPSPTTPSPTGVISTVPPSYGTPAPIPSEVGVGTLPDNTDPFSDTNVGTVLDGTYIVINLSVTVSSSPDDNYDLAIYEYNNNGYVYMDWMIVGITNSSDGSQYYEVFNWGDSNPDTNTNLGDVAGGETDDQQVDGAEFYDPDGAGAAPQSGILIDVDTASSSPPPATYNYVVVISPIGGMPSNNVQIDSLQTVEVPTPTP